MTSMLEFKEALNYFSPAKSVADEDLKILIIWLGHIKPSIYALLQRSLVFPQIQNYANGY